MEEPANITDEELGFATIPSKDDTEITAVLPDRVKLRIAANFVKGEVLRSEGRDEYEIVQLLDQDLEDRMGSLAKIHDTKALRRLFSSFCQL